MGEIVISNSLWSLVQVVICPFCTGDAKTSGNLNNTDILLEGQVALPGFTGLLIDHWQAILDLTAIPGGVKTLDKYHLQSMFQKFNQLPPTKAEAEITLTVDGQRIADFVATSSDGSWITIAEDVSTDVEGKKQLTIDVYQVLEPSTPGGWLILHDADHRIIYTSPPPPPPPGQGILFGTVTDLNTARPLPGAILTTQEGNKAITNGGGQYSLALNPGTYTITANAIGYQSGTADASIIDGQDTKLDFALQPLPVSSQALLIGALAVGALLLGVIVGGRRR